MDVLGAVRRAAAKAGRKSLEDIISSGVKDDEVEELEVENEC